MARYIDLFPIMGEYPMIETREIEDQQPHSTALTRLEYRLFILDLYKTSWHLEFVDAAKEWNWIAVDPSRNARVGLNCFRDRRRPLDRLK